MKKLVIFVAISMILAAFALPAVSYAQDQSGQPPTFDPQSLFKIEKIGEKELEAMKGLEAATDVGNKYEKFYAAITRILLGAATVLVVVGFFAAGVVYVSAQGNEETIKKAKNILLYTLLGVLIIAAAYGITLGISKLKP